MSESPDAAVLLRAIDAAIEAAEVVTEAASTYLFENESSAEETPLDRAIVACRTTIAYARQDIPTLLAALATAEERADEATEYADLYRVQWDEALGEKDAAEAKLAAAEAVVEAVESEVLDELEHNIVRYDDPTWPRHEDGTCARCVIDLALANYHKATGLQAENGEERRA